MLKYLFDIEILIRVALNILSTVCWSYASASICFGYITAVWVEWNFPFTLPFTLSFPTFPIFSFFRCLCCLIFFFLGVFVFFAVSNFLSHWSYHTVTLFLSDRKVFFLPRCHFISLSTVLCLPFPCLSTSFSWPFYLFHTLRSLSWAPYQSLVLSLNLLFSSVSMLVREDHWKKTGII